MNNFHIKTCFTALAVTGLLLFSVCFLTACATGSSSTRNADTAGNNHITKTIPDLLFNTPQETIYNGMAQPFPFSYNGIDTPEVFYFSTPEGRDAEMEGSHTAPILAGTYYVLVRCEYEDALAEYRIVKRPVIIEAAKIQTAIYNGNPKRISAAIFPSVSVYYSYYPNIELRDAAIQAVMKTAQGNSGPSLTTAFKGYTRIDRAPTEQGTYYVWVYFPGDANHESASMNVEFTILPP